MHKVNKQDQNDQKCIAFRCDGGPQIGAGHVMRCLGIAYKLHECGWHITFFVDQAARETITALQNTPFEILSPNTHGNRYYNWLIVDHYGLDTEYERDAYTWAKKIGVIDDLANRPHHCDFLLDQTYGRDPQDYKTLAPENCDLLCGSEYALLRPEFQNLRYNALEKRKHFQAPCTNILISAGNTNVHNIHGKTIETLAKFTDHALDLTVILGSKALYLDKVKSVGREINDNGLHKVDIILDAQDMAQRIRAADLAIGAGGTSSWERCCLGLPSLITVLADNQSKITQELDKAGAVINLGWHDDKKWEYNLLNALKNIDTKRYHSISQRAAKICDGSGLERIFKVITKT